MAEKDTYSVTITAMVTKTYEVQAASSDEADSLANAAFSLADDGIAAEEHQVTQNIIKHDDQLEDTKTSKPKM